MELGNFASASKNLGEYVQRRTKTTSGTTRLSLIYSDKKCRGILKQQNMKGWISFSEIALRKSFSTGCGPPAPYIINPF